MRPAHHKPFDKELYMKNDKKGKDMVLSVLEHTPIDTNVVELPETPRNPMPDLLGDDFYHEVAVAAYQWKDSRHLPDGLIIPARKIKLLQFCPLLYWFVCNDLQAAIFITEEDIYTYKIERRVSRYTEAGYEDWIITQNKDWRLIR